MSKQMLLLAAVLLAGALLCAQPAEQFRLEPRFEDRGSFLVMGIQAENASEGDATVNLWTGFFGVQSQIPEPMGKNLYGVCVYCPEHDPQDHDCYRYLVGMEVREKVDLPEGLVLHEVPAASYAVFEHVGLPEEINSTYEYIFAEWLPAHNRKMAQQDLFEQYDDRFVAASDKSLVEIWVPLVPAMPTDHLVDPDVDPGITP